MSSLQVGRRGGNLWQKTAGTVAGSCLGMVTSSRTPLQPVEEVSTHKGILKHGKFCALSSILTYFARGSSGKPLLSTAQRT